VLAIAQDPANSDATDRDYYALMAEQEEAEPLYLRSLELLDATGVLTDLARAHLLYGEWLRRQRSGQHAREQLRIAHRLFTGMGAEAFAERSRVELLATGERADRRDNATMTELPPQEAQIARLAAEGGTNREIAGRLFISASTVDHHLRKVCPKLGISSRQQLAHALSPIDGSDPTVRPRGERFVTIASVGLRRQARTMGIPRRGRTGRRAQQHKRAKPRRAKGV
jgi:DNA-binding CsgD family transcriptional regulator